MFITAAICIMKRFHLYFISFLYYSSLQRCVFCVKGTRLFCIAYDVIITKPFFRNHVILMFFSINGYTQSVYFPLMLMDIMNNSKTLANITRSMTDNLGALGWVLYLFISTVVIYAQVSHLCTSTVNSKGLSPSKLNRHIIIHLLLTKQYNTNNSEIDIPLIL